MKNHARRVPIQTHLNKDMLSREAIYITIQNPQSHTSPKFQVIKDEIDSILLKTEIWEKIDKTFKKKTPKLTK